MIIEEDKDSIVARKIGEKYLKMHSSHKLPSYYDSFPFYDRALPRISEKVKEIDGYLNFIDVGANIGDTVSLITDKVDGSFLCIEGDLEYLPFLKDNIKNISDSSIFIEESYCTEDDNKNENIKVYRENGTARLEENREKNDGKKINLKALDTIVKEYPEFEKTNILKIDTDGFEIKVLEGGRKLIKETKPIIYFEFDPELYSFNVDNPISIFDFLYRNGYHEALIYDNFGIPLNIIDTSNIEDIKKLISLIDKKKIYYFDVLTFHNSKKNHYKKLFESELLSNLSLFDRILDNTKSKLDSKDVELNESRNQFNYVKSQLELRIHELDTTKSQLDSKNTELVEIGNKIEFITDTLNITKLQLGSRIKELETIYYSRGWRFLMYIRKILSFVIPKESMRRKLVSFTYNFSKKIIKFILKIKSKIKGIFLFTKNYFNKFKPKKKRKINRNSKKIVFVDHSFHTKTRSSQFTIDYLRNFFDITLVMDEGWQGKPSADLSFVDETYLAVIFWQSLPSIKDIEKIKNDNIIHFPMYDNSVGCGLGHWNDYRYIKMINFSKDLHLRHIEWGFESVYLQYFPEPVNFYPGEKDKVFFWQRLSHININVIDKIFGIKDLKIHIHKVVDPGQEFIKPNRDLEKKLNITYSEWFDTKEEMLNFIKEKGIYIAPREYEGIGMSFLEAMAMGKAVIAVDNPTMNEYIVDGINGYLFNLKKPKEIDLGNIEQVQKNCHEFMKNGFKEWDKNKVKIIEFIKK